MKRRYQRLALLRIPPKHNLLTMICSLHIPCDTFTVIICPWLENYERNSRLFFFVDGFTAVFQKRTLAEGWLKLPYQEKY